MPIKLLPAVNGNPEWGDIAGNINLQSDLQSRLDSKSSAEHNHNLSELNEKSYNSLDDLPELSDFSKLSNMPQPAYCFKCDGIDDYFQIKSSIDIDVSENFSIIMRVSILQHGEFRVIAAKGSRSSNTGWTIFCDYGTLGFSIGDGSKYLTASHSQSLDEGKIYQISVSYNHSSKILNLGIDNLIEVFEFTNLNLPAMNVNPLLIGKNPASNQFTNIAVHSFFFIDETLNSDKLVQLFANGNFVVSSGIYLDYDVKLAFIPNYFGKYYWYDTSGNERHAEILGNMQPAFNPHKIIIPLLELEDDIYLTDAVPAGYSIDYITVFNHDTEDNEITITAGADTIVNMQIIQSEEEKIFSVNKLISFYNSVALTILTENADTEIDVHIILSNHKNMLK